MTETLKPENIVFLNTMKTSVGSGNLVPELSSLERNREDHSIHMTPLQLISWIISFTALGVAIVTRR